MSAIVTAQEIDQALAFLQSKVKTSLEIGLILGSGLGQIAEEVNSPVIIPAKDIPNWPVSSAPGHKGNIIFGELAGHGVIVLQGRTHFYEGYSMSRLGFPVRVMQRLGVKTLIITNAAGGINLSYSPGDLMIISDHISIPSLVGFNPITGAKGDELGERFVDLRGVYSNDLVAMAMKIGDENKLNLHKGVYMHVAGPIYQTPAETRFLRSIGADAIGMSAVPEAIVAHQCNIRVFGVSGITNKEDPDTTIVITHEDIMEAGRLMIPKLATLIKKMIPLI